MADNYAPGPQAYHQGFNVAALLGLIILEDHHVISGGLCTVLIVALIGFYCYRYK